MWFKFSEKTKVDLEDVENDKFLPLLVIFLVILLRQDSI